MSGPDDSSGTLPPDETIPPAEPQNDTEPPPPSFGHVEIPEALEAEEPPLLVVPQGHAVEYVEAVLSDVQSVFELLSGLAHALARQLDAQAEGGQR